MKHLILSLICLFCSVCLLNGQQTTTSSCMASDSITKLYRHDAARLAVRNVHTFAVTYKDSVHVDTSLRNTYWRALLAVYNATALGARDTVISIFNLHTRPVPEINSLYITANPSHSWMFELQANQPPSSFPPLNNLINKYNLIPTYFQGTSDDRVSFYSDEGLNLTELLPLFQALPGVNSASIETGFDDTQNIIDTIFPTYMSLTYIHGWGTCSDGCDHHRSWHFRVYNDCSVQYLGATGESLTTGVQSIQHDNALQLFPNPATESIRLIGAPGEGIVTITDLSGRVLIEKQLISGTEDIRIEELSQGSYLLTYTTIQMSRTMRFVRL